MTDERVSRRRVLAGSVGLAATSLAGCLGGSDGPLGNSVVQDTTVSGRSLVVGLQSDHSVSTLNVIGPSGSQFRSAPVATGATSVEVLLFDYRRGWHYEPGEYELVAVSDGEEVASSTVELVPDLQVTDVQQYTDGRPTPSNRANLRVTVENRGSGPTWVYYVGYPGAPYSPATNVPTDEAARTGPLLHLEQPQSVSEVIVAPGESTTVIGRRSPLLLSSDDECSGLTVEMTAIVATGVGPNARQNIRATLDGEPLRANFHGTCHDIEIDVPEGTATDG